MYDIEFKNVCKNYGNGNVIDNLNLVIPEGQRLILLGPSGCGKTTILRMIAGLESVTSGDLYMGGKRVNDVDPGDRNVGMVFQNYALYPHMTVEKNILFGMEINKVPKDKQQESLNWALDVLGLTEYKKRLPKELSGGQRQRVALCRALVKKSPYFLLDEPLSNLDAQLRTMARAELVKVHELYHPTFVYVTHDQIEAMTIGQMIVIINKSVIQQYDTPNNIYNRPSNVFVAKFIGSPSMNIVDAEIEGDYLSVHGNKVLIRDDWKPVLKDEKEVKFGFRPDHMQFNYESGDIKVNTTYVENHGHQLCIALDLGGESVMATTDAFFEVKKEMFMAIDWDKVHFFDKKTELNIGYPEALTNKNNSIDFGSFNTKNE